MNKRVLAGGTAVALTATMGLGALGAGPAQAAGNKPLSSVLDTGGFDRNGQDFDVVSQAVLAVLGDDPSSPVSLLTKGKQRATAFLPNDAAFKRLASALTGKQVRSEKKAFEAVAGLGLDTVEEVLLLHVVPGATISAKKALKSDGAKLMTAQGEKLTVVVKRAHSHNPKVTIRDLSKTSSNARVVVADINKGNKQIAHGINNVLLPKAL
ncbi:MAG: fasciclin domain-containing protein [Candidatus Nanopelagicales bacterium]